MLDIRMTRETTAPPEAVLQTLKEPSPERRGEIWSNITPKHFELHDTGPDYIEVTEGTFVIGVFWERCRYAWSEPDSVVATVVDSNVLSPQAAELLKAAKPPSQVPRRVCLNWLTRERRWSELTDEHSGTLEVSGR